MTSPVQTDETDLILLDLLQDEIPLVANPWDIIARKAGITQDEVLERLHRLMSAGVLRGIMPTIESDTMGPMVSTLIALKVPDEEIERVAGVVNRYQEVSHNFRRDHPYSLWFTLASPSGERIDTVLDEVLSLTGMNPDDMLNLTTEKKFKIDVRFPILRNHGEGGDADGCC